MRPLTLHASALSHGEYGMYTAAFQDLVEERAEYQPDAYYEETTGGVREARAWLRGRYPELGAADLDLVSGLERKQGERPLNSKWTIDTETVLSCAG